MAVWTGLIAIDGRRRIVEETIMPRISLATVACMPH